MPISEECLPVVNNTVTTALSRRRIIKLQNCERIQTIGKDEVVEHVPLEALVWKDTDNTHSLTHPKFRSVRRMNSLPPDYKSVCLVLLITVRVTSTFPYQLYTY